MKLTIYRLMYRLTNNRKWIIRYIDEMDKQIREDIEKFRKNKQIYWWDIRLSSPIERKSYNLLLVSS